MVKLQKRFAYKYKDKNHYKHIITIPDEIVHQLGWKEGIEIEPKVQDNELVLTLRQQKEN
jgi:bifunctional DNA-binding transcriptional regulator/antitoxin component of YhaV-PrlF toxin-antitoxin module